MSDFWSLMAVMFAQFLMTGMLMILGFILGAALLGRRDRN